MYNGEKMRLLKDKTLKYQALQDLRLYIL